MQSTSNNNHSGLTITRALVIAVVWLLLWRLSALMEYAPHASIWFPPSGLSFAALLLFGHRVLPVLFICALLSTYWIDVMYGQNLSPAQLLANGILFGMGHSFSLWAGASVVRAFMRRSATYALPKLVLVFLVAGSIATLLAALLGAGTLVLTGIMHASEYYQTWLPWWIGDMTGVLVIAPLCLALLSWRYSALEQFFGGFMLSKKPPLLHFVWKLAIVGGGISIALLVAAAYRSEEAVFLVFFLIIPMMWIAYTESPLRTIISLSVFSFLTVIWVAALGLIHYAMVYQFAIIITAATTYLGLSVPLLSAANQQLYHQASVDFLTGIASRRHFVEEAEYELERAQRYSQPLSLILFDLDRFKDINDDYGHAVGDEVLRVTARTITNALRQSDRAGRYGGDEFVILLPGLELEEAARTADRVRYILRNTPVTDEVRGIEASMGVTQLKKDELFTSLVDRADSALIQAKRSGRHNVVVKEL